MPIQTSSALPEQALPQATSRARNILVIALDEQSAQLGDVLANEVWQGAEFVGFRMPGASQEPENWRQKLERDNVDLILMVATAGSDLKRVEAIGGAGVSLGIKVSSALLSSREVSPLAISKSLLSLRSWSRTVTVIHSSGYLPGMLHALGA